MAGVAERVAHELRERPVHVDRERVDAEAEERVADHLRQVLVGEERAHLEDALVALPALGEDVEVAVPRVAAEALRDLREVEAVELGVLRARLQAHAAPLALVDEAPVAVALGAQPLTRGRIAQPRERRVGAALGDPRRQDSRHLAEPLAERRRIGEHVEAALPRRGHLLDRSLPAAFRRVRVVPDVQVRDLGLRAPGPGDLEELVDRVQQTGVAVANVTRVDAVVLAGHGVQAPQLLRRRLAARVELEPGRHPERARLHRIAHEALHQRHLLAGRARAGDARREPDRVVPDEPGEVLRVADLRDELQVLAEARPGNRRLVVAEGVEASTHVRLGGGRDRRVAPAAVADDLGRDALADRALGGRVREDREIAVAVRVDEARADGLARGVDDSRRRRARPEPADLRDPAAVDRDVAEEGRAARSVGHPAVPDQDVEHRYFLVISPTTGPRRGSRMSRSPSPRKLKPSTTSMIAAPGKIESHG